MFKNEKITTKFDMCLDGEPLTKLPLFILMLTANLDKHRSICMTRVVVCFWNGIKCVVWYTTIMYFANMKWHPVIWIKLLLRHRSGPKLAQVMACCLKAPSHYQNQCWLSISKVLYHSSEDPIKRNSEGTNQESKLGNLILKVASKYRRGLWVNGNASSRMLVPVRLDLYSKHPYRHAVPRRN